MPKVLQLPTVKQLFKAGAHFGHRKEHTDARSHSYVFTYRNKVSIIDLEKTIESLEIALKYIAESAAEGGTFIFIGTKMQAKDEIKRVAEELKAPYVVERWPGGLLTNYDIVTKSVKKMIKTEENLAENKYEHLTKKERLKIEKDLNKTRSVFGGLRTLERKPVALIAVDAKEETVAIAEAKSAGAKTIVLCDTNSNPRVLDYPIVANDDSQTTIAMILDLIKQTIQANFKPIASEQDAPKEEMDRRVEKTMSKKSGEKKQVGQREVPPTSTKKSVEAPSTKIIKKPAAKTSDKKKVPASRLKASKSGSSTKISKKK